MLQDGCFENAARAWLELFEYIEGYNNNQRKHTSIGYFTPNQFEKRHLNLNTKLKLKNKKLGAKNALHPTGPRSSKRLDETRT